MICDTVITRKIHGFTQKKRTIFFKILLNDAMLYFIYFFPIRLTKPLDRIKLACHLFFSVFQKILLEQECAHIGILAF